jgi:membrane protease YdiL (CAAX protease family)
MSSVLFGPAHPHYGLYVPIVVFYGWVFGWARLRSGGVGTSVALHMSVNAVACALLFLR